MLWKCGNRRICCGVNGLALRGSVERAPRSSGETQLANETVTDLGFGVLGRCGRFGFAPFNEWIRLWMALFNSESQWRSDSILDSYCRIVFSLASTSSMMPLDTVSSLTAPRAARSSERG